MATLRVQRLESQGEVDWTFDLRERTLRSLVSRDMMVWVWFMSSEDQYEFR
jgi:hypothetical protein